MSRVYSREEAAAMSRQDLEDACVGLSSDVHIRDARIAELEAQLAEGAEIILALTGRKPVTDADGNIVGFLEEAKL